MSWLHYLLEANIYLGVFYLCYSLLLTRDTHYNMRRGYLLFICILSFLLPLTQIGVLKPAELELVEPVAVSLKPAYQTKVQSITIASVEKFRLADALLYGYVLGSVIAVGLLCYRLYKLRQLANRQTVTKDTHKLVTLNGDNSAFSFFNYLFLGTEVPQPHTVIAHELVHIRQKHSADIIFLELIKAVNWFNPITYLIQHSLKTVHEYIADEQTAAIEQDTLAYSSFLLSNAYGIQGASITHSIFNYNLLKKRIIMLNQKRSGRLARLKYLALIPLCGGMLCTSTLTFSKNYGIIELTRKKEPMVIQLKRDSTKFALKLTDEKGFSVIGDKIRLNNAKNSLAKTYTVNSLTQKDQEDFRERNMHIEIIERNKANLASDTTPKKLPPPPPAKSKLAAPPKVKEVEIAPPPAVTKRAKRPAPPIVIRDQPAKPGKVEEIEVVPVPAKAPQVKLAPPPPYDKAYDDLFKHLVKTTRYPAVARDKRIGGKVLVAIRINNDHKITDVTLEKGIGYRCDEELIRAIRDYSGSINKPAGVYRLVGTFVVLNEENSVVSPNKPLEGNVFQSKNFMGQVILTASSY